MLFLLTHVILNQDSTLSLNGLHFFLNSSISLLCFSSRIKERPLEFSLVVQTCHPSTQEAEAGLQVQGQAGVYSEALCQ